MTPKYLRKMDDGYLYPYTETLAQRRDMQPVMDDPFPFESLPPIPDAAIQAAIDETDALEPVALKLHKDTLTLRGKKNG
jgi:hypothetical protein